METTHQFFPSRDLSWFAISLNQRYLLDLIQSHTTITRGLTVLASTTWTRDQVTNPWPQRMKGAFVVQLIHGLYLNLFSVSFFLSVNPAHSEPKPETEDPKISPGKHHLPFIFPYHQILIQPQDQPVAEDSQTGKDGGPPEYVQFDSSSFRIGYSLTSDKIIRRQSPH